MSDQIDQAALGSVAVNIVMTEPPGPDSQFVEVETDQGKSVNVGEWRQSKDGRYWFFRITAADIVRAQKYE